MNVALPFIKILRPVNLSIVGLSQIAIYHFFLLPIFADYQIRPVLIFPLWCWFVLDTILIAAGGYIINDIFDQSTDAINRPKECFVGGMGMSTNRAWWYYFLVVIIGFVIAVYIGVSIHKPYLIVIYPFTVVLLFLYSRWAKRMSLIGNFIVALFCVFVPGIIWYAESESLDILCAQSPVVYRSAITIFIAYLLFSFLSTMAREIIKDIEDMEGDILANCRTFPIVNGVDRSKNLVILFLLLLSSSYIVWVQPFLDKQTFIYASFLVVMMIISTVFILLKTRKANSIKDFTSISRNLKYLMLAALVVFLLMTTIF